MKNIALITVAALAAVVAAAFPATTAAHGDDPQDAAAEIAKALKHPLVVKGNARLAIVHVLRGCHSWSKGTGSPRAGVKVALRRGQRVTIVNQDLDVHRVVRLAGPKIALGGPLGMNHRITLRFTRPGLYKLRTRKVEMPDMHGMAEVETIGPDRILVMLVVVR